MPVMQREDARAEDAHTKKQYTKVYQDDSRRDVRAK